MNKTNDPLPVETHSTSTYKSLSKNISLFIIGVGCFVLIGWAMDISALKSVLPGLASMKSNTALLFVLCGISLWIQVEGKSRRIAQACTFIAAFVGLLTLGEYIFNGDLGIDQLLFRDTAINAVYPGRMSPASALAFLLIGLALLLPYGRFNEPLVITTFAISALALIGYIYGVSSLYQIGEYSSMALHTALSFILLSIAFFFARSDQGLMQTILADTAGGNILRRLIPVVLVFPILLGWVRLWGQRAGLYDTAFGLAIMVISLITTLAIFIWLNAKELTIIDINRKKANKTLLERENKLTTLFEILPVGISILDAERKVTYTNPALKKILDISDEKLLEGSYSNRKYLKADGTLMPVDELASTRAFKENKEINGVETGVVKEDDSIVWTEVSALPVDFRDWKLVVVTSDITERKQAEERFRLAVDSAPNAIIIVDQHGQIVLVNSQAEKYFGYDRTELIRNNIDILVPVRFRGNHANHRIGFLSHPQARAMGVGRDLFGLRKDGGEFPVEIGLAPLNTQEGMLVLATIVDNTERKRVEEDLRANARRLHLAASAGEVGIWDWDVVKDELIWDDSMYSLYSIPKGSFSGAYHAWTSTLHPDDRPYTEGEIQAALRGEREYAPEFRIIRPDGTVRIIKATSQTIRSEDGKALRMIGTNIDITERKQAEEEILKLNTDLEQKVAARTAELADANEQLHRLSLFDELTGLYNRRGFLLLTEEQLLLAKRSTRSLHIFYADLDGLKQINDSLGHIAGDQAIIAAARTLNETFRTSDIKARLGGDEFIVLVIDVEEYGSQILMERLQEQLAANQQSMSMGVVTIDPQNELSIDELIAKADQAMYREKRAKPGHRE